jgi:hypothetical protein
MPGPDPKPNYKTTTLMATLITISSTDIDFPATCSVGQIVYFYITDGTSIAQVLITPTKAPPPANPLFENGDQQTGINVAYVINGKVTGPFKVAAGTNGLGYNVYCTVPDNNTSEDKHIFKVLVKTIKVNN